VKQVFELINLIGLEFFGSKQDDYLKDLVRNTILVDVMIREWYEKFMSCRRIEELIMIFRVVLEFVERKFERMLSLMMIILKDIINCDWLRFKMLLFDYVEVKVEMPETDFDKEIWVKSKRKIVCQVDPGWDMECNYSRCEFLFKKIIHEGSIHRAL
jgi:hypothetical protein